MTINRNIKVADATIAQLAAALLSKCESTCDALTAIAVAVDKLSSDLQADGLPRCPVQDSIAAALADLAEANREAEQSTM